MNPRRPSSPARQCRWPIVLAILTMVGLLSALFSEGGPGWWLSWAALAAPLVVIARFWPLRRRLRP
ncbi:MAG: hypothetical protein K0Q54_3792 [Methylobacterium brachiatum]|jgi:hypothetical protein|nr:hypothetical protein [Methylobacterium brachiatum]